MPNLFPEHPPTLKKIMIVVDLRGTDHRDMMAGEYAVRVAGLEEIQKQDLVLLAAADTKTGTVVRGPEGLSGSIYEMEIVEAAGHQEVEEGEDQFINLRELLEAMTGPEGVDGTYRSDYEKSRPAADGAPVAISQAAAWIADRYGVDLPEAS